MINEYVYDIAMQMGMTLTKVSLTEGRSIGCYDASILSLASGSNSVSEFLLQSELDSLKNGINIDLFEWKIRAALLKLKMLPSQKGLKGAVSTT